MLRVALTGGIATGKSHVLEQFRKHGVPCLDADLLTHGVEAAGTEATQAIAARFGDVLAADGAVDRKKLAPLVFADPARGASSRRSSTRPSIARSPPACARSSCSAAIRSPSSTCRCCTKPGTPRTSTASS